MPRQARRISCTNTYHIMLRGINRQQIFEDRYDYIQFIKILYEVIPISNYELHSYCLMGNHIHLLITACNEPISKVMQRITIRFAVWYNKKYERRGHLFENRYKSEPVEDSRYYLAVIRYILQNPVKAHICESIFDYPWSSAHSYFNPNEQIVTRKIQGYFDSYDSLRAFLTKESEESFLDGDQKNAHQSPTDEQFSSIFFAITGCKTSFDFQSLEREQREYYLSRLVKKLPVKIIAQKTGYTLSYIYKFRKNCGDR